MAVTVIVWFYSGVTTIFKKIISSVTIITFRVTPKGDDGNHPCQILESEFLSNRTVYIGEITKGR
jgi:hypothetical protein